MVGFGYASKLGTLKSRIGNVDKLGTLMLGLGNIGNLGMLMLRFGNVDEGVGWLPMATNNPCTFGE